MKEVAHLLLQYIQKETPENVINLRHFSYTLQVGREAMDERVGLIVKSSHELASGLRKFVNGQTDVKGLYRGQVKRGKEPLDLIAADTDMMKSIDAWIQKRKFSKLLGLWVNGFDFDWKRLYGKQKPFRISLPTYPFARERYWATRSSNKLSVNGDQLQAGNGQLSGNGDRLEFQSTQPQSETESSSRAKQWFFVNKASIPQNLPNDLDWKGNLKKCRGKAIAIFSSDEEENHSFCALLNQLANAAELSNCMEIQTFNADDHGSYSFNKPPDVVFVLGPKRKKNSAIELIESELSAVFHVSQSLMKEAWNKSIRIYYLYEGSVAQPQLGSEALSGFLQSAMIENRAHCWKCIGNYDLDSTITGHQLLLKEWLFDESKTSDSTMFGSLRYENSQRFFHQLVEGNLNRNSTTIFRGDATYLIAGGLGPVGELLCQKIAVRYRSTLVILSRGNWDEQKQEQCRKLRSFGSKIHYYSVDIADRDALEKTYGSLTREVGPIHGVIHLARTVEDGLILSKSWNSIRWTIQAKVQGTVNLDECDR